MVQGYNEHCAFPETIDAWLVPVIRDLIERVCKLETDEFDNNVVMGELLDRLPNSRGQVDRLHSILTKNCLRFESTCLDLHKRIAVLEERIRELSKEEYRDEVHDR